MTLDVPVAPARLTFSSLHQSLRYEYPAPSAAWPTA